MHIITKPLSKLSKDKREKFFQSLGIPTSDIFKIRNLPPKKRLLEAAKLALRIDPTPNSDLIEWLAGYSWRGALYHHYKNLESLLSIAKPKISSFKRLSPISLEKDQIDLSKFIPEIIGDLKLFVDCDGNYLHIWQKVGTRVRTIKLRRKCNKKLFLTGVALYAGEGSKTPYTTRKIEIVNTSPVIVKTFIKFLDNLGIPKNKLKARIHAHSESEAEKSEEFWMKKINIKRKQFIKSLIRKSNKKRGSKKISYAIDIHYNSSMLRFLFIYWVNNLDKIIQKC